MLACKMRGVFSDDLLSSYGSGPSRCPENLSPASLIMGSRFFSNVFGPLLYCLSGLQVTVTSPGRNHSMLKLFPNRNTRWKDEDTTESDPLTLWKISPYGCIGAEFHDHGSQFISAAQYQGKVLFDIWAPPILCNLHTKSRPYLTEID